MIWILLLTVIAFSYCIRCGFVSDDTDQMANARPQKVDLQHWFVHGLDWLWFKLFKNHPVKWHLVVLGYHLITISLFYLFCNIFFGRQVAIIAASLFAIHPCTNQGAIWLSGRHYAILGWLTLSCLILWKWPVIFLPLLATACFVHPQGAVIPLILGFFKPNWTTGAYILIIAAFIPYYLKTLKARLKMCGWPKENTAWKSGRLNMLIKVVNYYLFMALIPFWLGFFHSNLYGYKKGLDKFNLKTALGVASLMIFAVLILAYRDTLPAFSLGAFWFFVTLLPCLNIIHSNMLFSERYMYIPLLGFCLASAQIISLIPYWQIILAVILTLYFVRTASYSLAYRDNIALYTVNTKNQPQSAEAFVNLGDQWIKINRSDVALPLLEKAIALDPEMDMGWFNLGVAQYNIGFIKKAKQSWEMALKINPKYINPRFNLLRLEKKVSEMQKQGQWRELAEVGLV